MGGDFDVEHSGDVLTVNTGLNDKKYVINRQACFHRLQTDKCGCHRQYQALSDTISLTAVGNIGERMKKWPCYSTESSLNCIVKTANLRHLKKPFSKILT